MDTVADIDITIDELNRYIRDYRLSHPEINDAENIMVTAIKQRFPGVAAEKVLWQAEINQIRKKQIDFMKKCISDPDKQIDTTVQGDLFNNYNARVPMYLVIDGESKPYYEVDPYEVLAWHQTREQSYIAEREAYKAKADESDLLADEARAQIEITKEIINKAIDNGIDPRTLRYAKKA